MTDLNGVIEDSELQINVQLIEGGAKGDPGEPGAKGDTGPKGDDGLTTAVKVGTTQYNHVSGTISLPAYPASLPADGGDAATVNGKTVLTNVPLNAKFTDTIYTHPANHSPSIITQDANNRFVTDTEKAAWSGKQNALGYTPVDKAGDKINGLLEIESTAFPVVDMVRNTDAVGTSLYGGSKLERKTTNPSDGVGISFYFKAPNSAKAPTHAGIFGGALGTIQAGSEKGEIVISPAYAGKDPHARKDFVVRAISASKAEAELNGKLRTEQTLANDPINTVATKKYVDDKVKTDVPENAVFTDTNTTYTEITTAEIDAGTASTLRTITGRRVKYILDKVQGWIGGLTKSDVGLSNVTNDKQMPISDGVLENYREKLVTLSGTSTAINLSLGNVFTHTLTGNTTYTITNAVNSQAHSFTLIITMGATVQTLTFPESVKWQGGEIPDMTTASKTYVLTFLTVDGGTVWLGMNGGEF